MVMRAMVLTFGELEFKPVDKSLNKIYIVC